METGEATFVVAAAGQVDDVLLVLDEAAALDCVASNARLRAYYEAAGFVFRGDAQVGGAPGQRLGEGPVTVVSRYELPLDANRSQ